MNEELLGALSQLMEARFSGLTKPIRKNLEGIMLNVKLV